MPLTKYKKANAILSIRCLVKCPNCESETDLFERHALTEEGYIYSELMSDDDGWGHKDWGEVIPCNYCGGIFIVGEVVY